MGLIFFSDDDMCTTKKLEMRRIQDFFKLNGWDVTRDPDQADIVLCVTCSGWEKLEQKSLETLESLQHLGDKVIALGCVTDVNPGGVRNIHAGRCISSLRLDKIAELIPNPRVKLEEVPEPSVFRTREDYRLYDLTKRFVNIANGCSFACSYCPHKVGLGPRMSRTEDHILKQIEGLVAEGVRIVVLTGMETAYYGLDIKTDYPSLLKKVLDFNKSYEVHVAQFHPAGVLKYYDRLLPFLQNDRVTDIQIPIQTTSDRLLKLMRRPPGTDTIADFLSEVKKVNKVAVLRTDIMVGFPSETMEELDKTLDFVTDVFDEVAVYGFEMRKGLAAQKLMGQAFSGEEIERRVAYGTRIVEARGAMAHGGQQSDVSLIEVERRKQAIREAKKRGAKESHAR
jgi:MiaB/RimO family radical SAM methylthiotransferase